MVARLGGSVTNAASAVTVTDAPPALTGGGGAIFPVRARISAFPGKNLRNLFGFA